MFPNGYATETALATATVRTQTGLRGAGMYTGDENARTGLEWVQQSVQRARAVEANQVTTKMTKYSWRAFSDVSEHNDFILLWFDRGQCLAIPDRALANQETRRNFVSLARQHITPA
jgi:hypothetical protein